MSSRTDSRCPSQYVLLPRDRTWKQAGGGPQNPPQAQTWSRAGSEWGPSRHHNTRTANIRPPRVALRHLSRKHIRLGRWAARNRRNGQMGMANPFILLVQGHTHSESSESWSHCINTFIDFLVPCFFFSLSVRPAGLEAAARFLGNGSHGGGCEKYTAAPSRKEIREERGDEGWEGEGGRSDCQWGRFISQVLVGGGGVVRVVFEA